jgi:channel protein (hemolysin III family)
LTPIPDKIILFKNIIPGSWDISLEVYFTIYLGLGWMGVFMGYKLWLRYGFVFIQPLVIGGICYTVGAIIEYRQKLIILNGIIGPHEVLHIAVLAGIGFQWWFIIKAMDRIPINKSEIR